MLLSACITIYLSAWLILRPASGYEEPGLYDDAREVAYLDHENFYKVVLNSGRAWLVQFYNSWCGHCMDFAPIYQEFARNVSRWTPAVGIAAINCADEHNIALCRANKIEAYPTMKTGPPNATSAADFTKVTVKMRTTQLLIEMLLKYLLSLPYHFPGLRPIGTTDKLWEILEANNGVSPLQPAIFLLEEGPDSYIGPRIIMDTFGGTGLTVLRNVNSNLTGVVIYKVEAASKTLTSIAKNLETYEEVAGVLHPHLLVTDEVLANYILTRKPRVTVASVAPKVETPKAFSDEEIMEQVSLLRANRKNSSTAEEHWNGTSTAVPVYVASLQQRGFLVTMEEYREAVVLVWRKRLHGYVISSTADSSLTTHSGKPSSNASITLPAVVSLQSSYSTTLQRSSHAAVDLVMPKNVTLSPSPAVSAIGGVEAAVALQLGDLVQLSDLLFAVRKSVAYEIPLRLNDDDAAQLAVARRYIKVLTEFLPCPASYRSALGCLDERLNSLPQVTSAKWIELVQECQLKGPLDRDSALASCKGSTARYRGYPCTMWTLFHTLTVAEADIASRLPEGGYPERSRVLVAMRDYMGSFFGCSECSHNFIAMATALNLTSATAGNESILWLWTAHNHANARLRGARSEDPEHRKQQYPPVELCSTCSAQSTLSQNGSRAWSIAGVVSYLKAHYAWSSIVSPLGLAVEQPPLPSSQPAAARGQESSRPLPAGRSDLFDRLKAAAAPAGKSSAAAAEVRGDDRPGGDGEAKAGADAALGAGRLMAAAGGQPGQGVAAKKWAADAAAASPKQQDKPSRPIEAAAVVAGSMFPPRAHELHRRDAKRPSAATSSAHLFPLLPARSFSSADLAVIALLYTLCGVFIAVFYYHFVVAKRMRIKIM